MTFEEKLKELLVENGMFESQADEVISIAKKEKVNESMEGLWSDNIEDYPDIMLGAAWLTTKTTALRYIEKECPQAWFKPMFM